MVHGERASGAVERAAVELEEAAAVLDEADEVAVAVVLRARALGRARARRRVRRLVHVGRRDERRADEEAHHEPGRKRGTRPDGG